MTGKTPSENVIVLSPAWLIEQDQQFIGFSKKTEKYLEFYGKVWW